MADFQALNERRSETLRQIREMVREEAALWTRYFNGHNTSEMLSHIERNRAGFRELWDGHEAVRRQMVEAGFIPPPVEPDDLFRLPLEDPARDEIENGLKATMEAARAEYYTASQEFRLFVGHGTGLPAPDGNLHARQIAAAHSAALRKYTGALRRFNSFLVDGKLPPE
jgi:hypothetical protein